MIDIKKINLETNLNEFFSKTIREFEIYYILREREEDENIYESFYCLMPGLKKDLEKNYKSAALEIIKKKGIVKFDVVVSEEDCIEVIQTNEVKNLKKILDKLNKIEAKVPSEIEVSLPDIWGYVITFINSDNKKLTLYRKFIYPKAFNERKKVSMIEGRLEEVDKEIFTIDMCIDAMELDGITYITNKYYFEKFFEFNDEYRKCVEASLEDLKKEDIIENFDEFANRCLESNNLVRKLVYVVKEGRLKWLKKNIKNAETVVQEYKLKVSIENDKVCYSKKTCNITDVMKLICGCCVKDAVDMQKYFATSIKEVS